MMWKLLNFQMMIIKRTLILIIYLYIKKIELYIIKIKIYYTHTDNMSNNATKVFQSRYILTQIFNFLGDDDIRETFLPTLNRQILIYGQVQSGKTSKIMEYMKNTKVTTKILLIQNSLSMLAQYERALSENKIAFSTISNPNINSTISKMRLMDKNMVLLVMNNNYRREILEIISDCPQSINNIPIDAKNHGYKVLSIDSSGPTIQYLIQK